MATVSRSRDSIPTRQSSKDTIIHTGKPSPNTSSTRTQPDPVKSEGKHAARPCTDYGTPIADSYSHEKPSSTSTPSILTSSSTYSTPTPTSRYKPSIPQKAHTKSNSYRLGPAGNEGWVSETSSMSTVKPPRFDVSGSSSPRRDNPKSSMNVGLGEGMLVVPVPKVRPGFDVVAEYMGLKLCRVCDAVPYLLSTRNMLDRLQAIADDNFTHASSIYDSPSISAKTPHKYTDRDRALMAILSSLRTLSFARHQRGNWYPQGLAIKNDTLILYNHVAPYDVQQTCISLSTFIDMAQTWLSTRNPTNLSGESPLAKNSWLEIAATLTEAHVDLSKIDLRLYTELTTVLQGDALTAKINDLIAWSRNGRLDERWTAWSIHLAKTAAANPSLTPPETCGRIDGLYSKRFTHKHPLGRPRSVVSEDEKAERRAERLTRANADAEAFAAAVARRERKMAAGSGCLGGVRRYWMLRRKMVVFVLFIVLLFAGILGAIVWAMATNRWDFTAGGEGF